MDALRFPTPRPASRKRIGVLLGGDSPERPVSLGSGETVLALLQERGYDAVPIYVDRDVDLGLRQARIDVAFIALHGQGADGAVQGLLESLGIPYTGPSLAAAALSADKLKAKELLRLHNLPTPTYYCHARGVGSAAEQHGGFGYPCVVKPRLGGSGIGVARVEAEDELDAAVEIALRFDDHVLVERHVAGREVQVVIVDGHVLGVAEVVMPPTPSAAGTRREPQVIVPPRLGAERLRGVLTLALRAYHLFGCEGVGRVDVMVSERGNENLLDVNALPDLGPSSLVPKLAHAAGIDYGELVERLVAGARLHNGRRQRERRSTTPVPWSGVERRAPGTTDPH